MKITTLVFSGLLAIGNAVTVPDVRAESAPVSQPAAAIADEQLLRNLLDDFLGFTDATAYQLHSRFWADDLVYTSSAGERFGKAEILKGLKEDAGTNTQPTPVQARLYFAEDVDVRIFNNVAVVAFRLVYKPKGEEQHYFNTGTFVKRKGEWRAVAWQATKIPSEPKLEKE